MKNEFIKPLIAVTMGDPAGVGPEITAKALLRPEVREACRPFAVGDLGVLRRVIRDAGLGAGAAAEVFGIKNSRELAADRRGLAVLDVGGVTAETFRYGTVRAEYGSTAGRSIEAAVACVRSGEAEAVVTAPLNKEALHAAGYPYPGHTEMLAALSGGGEAYLMLAIGGFRVVHATLHLRLADVPRVLTREKVLKAIQVTGAGLRSLGIPNPRIGVAGLNPHAGEGGLFGDEETRIIAPAVEEARRAGLKAEGPLSGDTVFAMLRGGRFDAVVAMYHDQGGIPMKLLGFTWDAARGGWGEIRGVNVTLGLPIIRTSVAHGTGFDIAGRGVASERSLVDAILLAVQMAAEKEI